MTIEVDHLPRDFMLDNQGTRFPVRSEHFKRAVNSRLDTAVASVERVILWVQERLGEPISLRDMADVALLSPYHFNRVFSSVTGLPPCRFLSALRLYEAKRLLLCTPLSVTEVCFEVGYNSLGTFTHHFAQMVGLPPRRFRRMAQDTRLPMHRTLRPAGTLEPSLLPSPGTISGRIALPGTAAGLIFVGLFSKPIPQGRPVSCTLMHAAGTYHLRAVPDGSYYVFAAEFARSDNPLAYLLPNRHAMRVGSSGGRVVVNKGQVSGPTDVMLRIPKVTDPPILVALPCLLVEWLSPYDGLSHQSK